ncbi:MAG TPA: EAL domain-containing protein [Bacilli bacterium]
MIKRFLRFWNADARGQEQVTVTVVVIALIAFFTLLSVGTLPFYKPSQNLIWHTVAEFFSVIVSLSIALQGWIILPYTKSLRRLLIAALFLPIGILDLTHTLTYPGLLEIWDNRISEWFWILARVIEALGLLTIFALPERIIARKSRVKVLTWSLVFTFLTFWVLVIYADHLPLPQSANSRFPLANMLEIAVSALRLLTVGMLVWQYFRQKQIAQLTIIKATVFLFLGELFFVITQHYFDTYNITGHLFKDFGYFGLLKGIYMTAMNEPYNLQIMTEKELTETKFRLEESDQRYKSLFDYNPDLIFSMNLDGDFLSVNAAGEAVIGYGDQDVAAVHFSAIVHPDDRRKAILHFQKTVQGVPQHYETRVLHKNGDVRLLSVVNVPIVVNQEVVGIYGIARDITQNRRKEEEINYLAYHDDLTGLPNRRKFQEELQKCLKQAQAKNARMAVLFLDIDRFKNLNDSLGHAFGDLILKQIADRLKNAVTDRQMISRMGGDEFTILIPEFRDANELESVCQAIFRNFEAPFSIAEMEYRITPSIGIAAFPDNGNDIDALMKNADIAMYRAKERRSKYEFYNPGMHAATKENLMLENDLRKALDLRQFSLHMQPQIDTRTGEVIGAEALLRWNHPTKGVIAPTQFIPLAEDTGLIIPIGEWVVREACKQASRIHSRKKVGMRIAVNLSMRQFFQHDLVNKIADILQETKTEPGLLEIEITESMAMDVEYAVAHLKRLKQLGVWISIDDFGTGYSSLSYLKSLPIDRLKIDRTFVRDISGDASNAAIVAAIIAIAHHLNLDVVAEGVETKEQIEFLNQYGCFKAQGFYYSKPLNLPRFESLFAIS